MFAFVGRTAARRALGSAISSTSIKSATNPARVATFRRLAPIARSFTVSAWIRSPTAAGAGKKKATATKKKPAKKAAPKKKKTVVKKKKTVKVLTPEQKEKAEIRELKTRALLKGPTFLPDTTWSVYLTENITSGDGPLPEKAKHLASTFKTISDLELNRLKNIAASNKDANLDTRREWVESYAPEVIHVANLARRRLARKLNKSRVYVIHDERLPKRTGNAYTAFVKSRFSQVNDGSAAETFKVVAEEWKLLPEHEKSQFKDRAAAEAESNGEVFKELRQKGEEYWKAKKAEAKKTSKTKSE